MEKNNDKDIQTVPNPAIYRSIAGVIADVGAVAKDKVNKQQGFKFRSIDDVYNALHPALAKNKVFIVPRIIEQTREVVGVTKNGAKMTLVICKIKFTFYAEDGSHIESVIIGEALDTGDKATNKAMAIAYKYACFQVFCIPTEEMLDPDAERPELNLDNQKNATAPKKPVSKPASKPAEKPAKSAVAEAETQPEDFAKGTDRATPAMIQTVKEAQKLIGVKDEQILGRVKVKSKSIDEITIDEFKYIMSVFEATNAYKEAKHE